LHYPVNVNGFVECDDAWVSMQEQIIECDYEAPEAPSKKRKEIVTE
jgi:hypothetical protein